MQRRRILSHLVSLTQCKSLYSSQREKLLIGPENIRAKYQLVDYLKSRVFFSNDDYIACLKPYGVKNSLKRSTDAHGEEISEISVRNPEHLFIRFIMPLIAQAFNEPFLFLASTAPTNSAGIILFAKNHQALRKFNKAKYKAIEKKLPYIKILCICVGIPDPPEGEEILHIVKENIGDKVIYETGTGEYSQRQIKRHRTAAFPMQYRTLTSSGDFSLVEVRTVATTWHNHRLLLMKKGAPVLGDETYQQRIAKILDKSVFVDPKSACRKNQYIPLDFLKSAGLSLADYFSLPIFNVVQEMVILKGLKSEDIGKMPRPHLYLKCPLPAYFSSALNLLFPDFNHDFVCEK